MGMRTKTVQPRSQATPLSEDVIRELQGRISSSLGQSFGNIGEAGTNIRQLLSSGGGIRDVASPGNYITNLEAIFQRNLDRSVADLREGTSITGNRFGTGGQLAESRLRSDALTDFGGKLSELELGLNQVGIQRDTGVAQLMAGLSQTLAGLGQTEMAPFLALASQGIIPEEVIASPNPWLQLGTSLIQGAGNFYGAKKQ